MHLKLPRQRPRSLRRCPSDHFTERQTQPRHPAGLRYLAVVLDVFSSKVMGWAFGQQQTAELVIAALNMGTSNPQARPRRPGRDPPF